MAARTFRQLAFIIACGVLALVQTPLVQAQAGCIEAGKENVVLRGKLEVTGKARDRAILLRSASGICLTGPDEEDKVAPTWVLHVFGDSDEVHGRLSALIGKQVEVSGRLLPAHTAHHKAPIIVETAAVKPTS